MSREAKARQRRPEAATYLQRVSMTISVLVFADGSGDIFGISFFGGAKFGFKIQNLRSARTKTNSKTAGDLKVAPKRNQKQKRAGLKARRYTVKVNFTQAEVRELIPPSPCFVMNIKTKELRTRNMLRISI
ncbi:MAG TPA: hypothetical protein VIH72_03010 [Candidatus Acidoferrales bacterium]